MHTNQSPVSSWRIDRRREAQLDAGGFRAIVQVDRPQDGVSASPGDDPPIGDGHLLQLITRGSFPPAADSFYERGCDLVATYDLTDAHSIRTQVYWRKVEADAAVAMHGGIDLIVSVQTDSLDADPGMCVRSSLNGRDVLYLADAVGDRWESTAAWHDDADSRKFRRPPGCFLVRLPEGGFDYLEMIHPADLRSSAAVISESSGSSAKTVQIDHRLFDGRLEKGVILRSRVRGVFLTRDVDPSDATRCYRQFAGSEPPLTV